VTGSEGKNVCNCAACYNNVYLCREGTCSCNTLMLGAVRAGVDYCNIVGDH